MQRSLPNPSIDYVASAPAPPLPCQQRASVVTRYVAACHMGATVLHETAFRKAEDVVKGWGVGHYMHHTQLKRELVESGGVEFLVTFSKPLPKCPVPPQVAMVLLTIEPDDMKPGNELRVSYAVEGEQQRRPETEPFRLAWLDSIVHRKQLLQAEVGLFGKQGDLPEPRAFVPGSYSADRRAPDGSPRKARTAQGAPGNVRVALSSSQGGDVTCRIELAER